MGDYLSYLRPLLLNFILNSYYKQRLLSIKSGEIRQDFRLCGASGLIQIPRGTAT